MTLSGKCYGSTAVSKTASQGSTPCPGAIVKGAKINYTWPGRLHVIWHERYVWLTLWLFGYRFHYGPRLS